MKSLKSNGPDFMCIGMQKAATNWVYDQLASHDNVWMPPLKELHFFDNGFNFDSTYRKFNRALGDVVGLNGSAAGAPKGDLRAIEFFRRSVLSSRAIRVKKESQRFLAYRKEQALLGESVFFSPSDKSLDWYRSLFLKAPHSEISGDITPGYSRLPDDRIKLIHSRYPDLKIILGVRRPVERAWSQLCQNLRRTTNSQTEQVDKKWLKEDFLARPQVLERSFPVKIHDRWARYFDKNMHVYFFEDVIANPHAVRQGIAEFLGIPASDRYFNADPSEDKKSKNVRIEMSSECRDVLESFFENEISEAKTRFSRAEGVW